MINYSAVVASRFGIAPVVMYVLAVIAVIALAYLTTIAVAKLYNKGTGSTNIKIIERVNIATDKSLWLISLGEKYYFLYTDRNGLSKIDEVDGTTLTFVERGEVKNQLFVNLLKNKLKRSADD